MHHWIRIGLLITSRSFLPPSPSLEVEEPSLFLRLPFLSAFHHNPSDRPTERTFLHLSFCDRSIANRKRLNSKRLVLSQSVIQTVKVDRRIVRSFVSPCLGRFAEGSRPIHHFADFFRGYLEM